jgi:hypothetical protein
MSQQALDEVLRKASSDPGFRTQLGKDFESTVKSYDLSEPEKQQLRASAGAAVADPGRKVPQAMAAAEAQDSELQSNEMQDNELLSTD